MEIGILYICTGKYTVFWKDFYLSCEKNFMPETKKHYFVFTDNPEIDFESENQNIHRIYQKNLGWPDNTLMRFDMFSRIKDSLFHFDYLFFLNADTVCLEKISASDILPRSDKNLVAVLHPGYFDKKRRNFQYEAKKSSTAFIDKYSGKYYFAGGFNGGKTKPFLKAIDEMKSKIELDKKNGIIAKWHDESHWNKYLESRSDIKILHSGYLYPESSNIPFKKIIMIRDKRKYFSYQEVGKKNINPGMRPLQKIKIYLRKIPLLQRLLILQILKNWIMRVRLLLTVYKHTKIKAIKNYLKNDLEYIKIRKEINKYRVGRIFDFDGIKLPICLISPDTYLNVLKPAIEKIDYTPQEIQNFYIEQKKSYKTLFYWNESQPKKEPDYIGGHIISHGFTYFFREIIINKDDVVIDLGAAPGDFSALCVKNGAAKVYAFEPEENSSSNLSKVSRLNGDKIEIIRKYSDDVTHPESKSISLDDFVKINNITKIDFIKSDIEGSEIKALVGAKNILKNHRPRLAFCTYHSITDEENIARAILNSNPDYKIYRQKGIIYAF